MFKIGAAQAEDWIIHRDSASRRSGSSHYPPWASCEPHDHHDARSPHDPIDKKKLEEIEMHKSMRKVFSTLV